MGDNLVMMVPLVSKYAYAGYTAGFGDDEYIEELPKIPFLVDKEYKGIYRAFEVKGDSMDNGLTGSYKEGYIVLGREVAKDLWRDKLHLRKWKNFVVVTERDGVIIKEISKHDTAKGIITLHSLNPDFADVNMKLSNVKQLFNVIRFIGE
jgi:phage repressor protein C with HTH and peptisase S24 domain